MTDIKNADIEMLISVLDDEVQALVGVNHEEWAKLPKKKYNALMNEIHDRLKGKC